MSTTNAHRFQTLGLVGAGLMGQGIASNLARKGHAVVVLDHPGNQPFAPLEALGVRSARNIVELAAQVDTLLICVTGAPQVRQVLIEQALSHIKSGTWVLDFSTSLPETSIEVAAALQQRGCVFLDTPMTRTPKEAAEGRLNLLVGSAESDFDQAKPLLEKVAENITWCGPVGSGHAMKLLHNFVSLGSVALIAEAAACAQSLNVDLERFVQVLAQGGGGGTALDRMKPTLLNNPVPALKFSINNAAKDLGYFQQMAQASGSPHQVADGLLQTLGHAKTIGMGDQFVPELYKALQIKAK